MPTSQRVHSLFEMSNYLLTVWSPYCIGKRRPTGPDGQRQSGNGRSRCWRRCGSCPATGRARRRGARRQRSSPLRAGIWPTRPFRIPRHPRMGGTLRWRKRRTATKKAVVRDSWKLTPFCWAEWTFVSAKRLVLKVPFRWVVDDCVAWLANRSINESGRALSRISSLRPDSNRRIKCNRHRNGSSIRRTCFSLSFRWSVIFFIWYTCLLMIGRCTYLGKTRLLVFPSTSSF